MLFQAPREARFGLRLQFLRRRETGLRHEFRQDGIALLGKECAAPGDLDRVFDRFGQIGELRGHFRGRFEPVFAGETPAILLRHECAVGDAEQRIMRFIHIGAAEMHIVGRDQRDVFRVGEIDQLFFRGALFGQTVTLQLDIEPVAEHRLQPVEKCGRRVRLAFDDQAVERTARPTRQCDQSFGMGCERCRFDMRPVARLGAEIGRT